MTRGASRSLYRRRKARDQKELDDDYPHAAHTPPSDGCLSALAGAGYTAAWIISLSVGAPNPSVAAPGTKVVAAFAGRGGPALVQFAFNEGIAAVALVTVVTLIARAARRCGPPRAGLAAAAFGTAAAGVSWAQLALGAWLFSALVPDRRTAAAGAVYHAITRIDGVKMFLLAAMALAISQVARKSRILPRWLAPTGVLLAAALLTSGIGYLLLCASLASAVYVSGLLLLIFVCATGMTLRSRRGDDALAQARLASRDADDTGVGRPGMPAACI